ncbi:MAG: YceI family protein [Actinomycetota bacterium]|nr:YceI family protein [Actinomycetota bacterium]
MKSPRSRPRSWRTRTTVEARRSPSSSDSWHRARCGSELAIGGVTAPLALAVELSGVEDFFDGTRHAGFDATGEIRRKDFGLGLGDLGLLLGDVVTLELDLEFIEPG